MYQNDDDVDRALANVLVPFSAFLTLIIVLFWAIDVLLVDDSAREFKDACVTLCILSGLTLVPRAWQLKEDDKAEAWVHFFVATLPAILPVVSVSFIHLYGKEKLKEAVQCCEEGTDKVGTSEQSEQEGLVNSNVTERGKIASTVSLATWKL